MKHSRETPVLRPESWRIISVALERLVFCIRSRNQHSSTLGTSDSAFWLMRVSFTLKMKNFSLNLILSLKTLSHLMISFAPKFHLKKLKARSTVSVCTSTRMCSWLRIWLYRHPQSKTWMSGSVPYVSTRLIFSAQGPAFSTNGSQSKVSRFREAIPMQ